TPLNPQPLARSTSIIAPTTSVIAPLPSLRDSACGIVAIHNFELLLSLYFRHCEIPLAESWQSIILNYF
ncbi:hypothetical protein, partial [Helicobacter sp.]|uniref:hypothetical protein n=1 Tax=Helicobacter sp. TaxID=218 RepID=UPI0025BF6F9B